MPPRSRKPGPDQIPIPGQEPLPALVQILTPEFQGIDPREFDDITPDVVRLVAPEMLRASLLNVRSDGRSTVSYRLPESGQWQSLVATPREFILFSRHIPMLAKTALNGTLDSRDKKLQEKTGDPYAKARSDEDLAAADRSGVHAVEQKIPLMKAYLERRLLPQAELIAKFKEMASHPGLNRGKNETIKAHFEALRKQVFGDMLDAIGNQRKWNEAQANSAARTLQKRLYLDPSPRHRVANFDQMLELGDEYIGHKRALVLGRIAEAKNYLRNNRKIE